MLYIGYVGFSVAFAFAIAAMLAGELDQQWARWTRPWTTTAWMFLTVGICLGQLVGVLRTGLGRLVVLGPGRECVVHAVAGRHRAHSFTGGHREARAVQELPRCCSPSVAFSLSLLGTFLVRSGVLVSVHAFASDPARGIFILAFLGVVVGTSLGLYAWRASSLEASVGFKACSRETFILLNNILLVIAAGGHPARHARAAGVLGGRPRHDIRRAAVFRGRVSAAHDPAGAHDRCRHAHRLAQHGRRANWSANCAGPRCVAVVAGVVVPYLVFGSFSVMTALGSYRALDDGWRPCLIRAAPDRQAARASRAA